MTTRIFHTYGDPCHSWTKVQNSFLCRLLGPGWRNHFTPYSHERDEWAYLEEDEDHYRFSEVLAEHGIQPIFRFHDGGTRRSRIRSYPFLRTSWKHGDPRPAPDAYYP
jgi:hypothetical protein